MKQTTSLLAAICSTLILVGGAYAQSATGNNAAPSGNRDMDCARDTYSASGTGSSHPVKAHRSVKTANAQTRGTIPAAYAQCTSDKNRSTRAQCIRAAYESRLGVPSSKSTSTASNSMRKPC